MNVENETFSCGSGPNVLLIKSADMNIVAYDYINISPHHQIFLQR